LIFQIAADDITASSSIIKLTTTATATFTLSATKLQFQALQVAVFLLAVFVFFILWWVFKYLADLFVD